jgi:hypothetical protein
MEKSELFAGMTIGGLIVLIITALPFSDAARYRKAIDECERTLPRNVQCKVVGVPNV